MTGGNSNSFGRRSSHRRMLKRSPQSQTQSQFGPSFSVTWTGDPSTPTDNGTTPTSPTGTTPTPTGNTKTTPTPNNTPNNPPTGNTQNNVDTNTTTSQSSATTTATSSSTTTTTSAATTTATTSTTPLITPPVTPLSSISVPPNSIASRPLASGLATTPGSAPTESTSSTGSLSTGSIVGIAAGGLVGFGVLVIVGLWLIKRFFRNKDEFEMNRDSYLRNSVHVADEDPSYFNQPRPPTMIERHFGAAGIGAHGNFASFNSQDQDVPSPPANPFTTPIGSPIASTHDVTSRDVTLEDAMQQRPYVSRSPSLRGINQQPQQPMYYNEEPDPLAAGHYADLQRGSVTPYQAAQYAEISRQLNNAGTPTTPTFDGRVMSPGAENSRARMISPAPVLPDLPRVMSPVNMNGGQYTFPMPGANSQNFSMPSQRQASGPAQLVTIPENLYAGHEANVQYGFNHQGAGAAGGHLAVPGVAPTPGKRPVSEYEEEDAYGGM